jgi:hypothetical protein
MSATEDLREIERRIASGRADDDEAESIVDALIALVRDARALLQSLERAGHIWTDTPACPACSADIKAMQDPHSADCPLAAWLARVKDEP